MKTHGRDGTPNDVPAEIPPLDFEKHRVRNKFHTYQYRRLGTTDKFQWALIATRPESASAAAESIRQQCKTWGIPVVPEQWRVIRATETTVQTALGVETLLDLTNR